MILHITTHNDWKKAKEEGSYVATSLQSEGFIHCSTLQQVTDTANNFFKGKTGLVLLCIDESKLKSELRYESPTGEHDPGVGKLFPHVYGPIQIEAVIKAVDFPSNSKGIFVLPNELDNKNTIK